MRDGVVDSPPYGDRSSVGIAPKARSTSAGSSSSAPGGGSASGARSTTSTRRRGRTGSRSSRPATARRRRRSPARPRSSSLRSRRRRRTPTCSARWSRCGSGRHADPAGRRRARRARHRRGAARRGGAGRDRASPLRLILRPEWTGSRTPSAAARCSSATAARSSARNEAFTSSQLAPRAAAHGCRPARRRTDPARRRRRPPARLQRRDDELRAGADARPARRRHRLRARRRRLLDAGVRRQAAEPPVRLGRRAPVPNALQLMYYGVYAPTADAVVSPNGDGFAETQRQLSYKVVRPSTVTATLVGPGEVPAFTETVEREPGTYPVAFPPAPADPLGGAAAPGRGPLAARCDGHRRSRPDLDHEPAFHGQQHARLREALTPHARRPRARQADDPGRGHADAGRAGDRDRRDEVGRPGRRRSRSAARPPAGSSRAGAARPAAAGRSSTAACYVVRFRATNDARRRRRSSARRSASSARRRCRSRSPSRKG